MPLPRHAIPLVSVVFGCFRCDFNGSLNASFLSGGMAAFFGFDLLACELIDPQPLMLEYKSVVGGG